jgi:hypothetical protein
MVSSLVVGLCCLIDHSVKELNNLWLFLKALTCVLQEQGCFGDERENNVFIVLQTAG